MNRHRRIAVLLILMFLISYGSNVVAYQSGKTGSTSGCNCHAGGNQVSPTLSGLPSDYTPGTVYSLTIGATGSPSGTKGGFNLDSSKGSWSNPGTNAKLQSGEVTHSNRNSRSWTVDWTAPSTGSGTVTFYLAVLFANGNGANSGDGWGTNTWSVAEAVSSSNNPPEVSSIVFDPVAPTAGSGLAMQYTYYDADGDSEDAGQTEIRWYRDGLHISGSDDALSVPNSWVAKGQQWVVEVRAHDGLEFGSWYSHGPVIIGNTLPIARNLEVSPSEPLDTDSLTFDYDYYDLDGDIEQDTVVRWYLDGARITELDDEMTVSSLMIRSGDEWEARVTPHDGEDAGITKSSGIIVIGSSNNQPTCSAYLTPGNPATDNPLQIIVGWHDTDGDELDATEIRWFKDGTQISAYNDMEWVPSEATSKGETWSARARVSDGLIWSEWADADGITVLNTPPVVTEITMHPEGTLTTDLNLSVTWEQYDLDGDVETGSEIRWWVNGEWLPEYNGWTEIPASETYRDQHWSVQVIPRDGESLGSGMTTIARLIENGAPVPPTIALGAGESGYLGEEMSLPSLGEANSLENLVVQASSTDPDEEYLFYDVQWSRNGYHVPDLDGESAVPSDRLEQGQEWIVTVFVEDPWGLSNEASASVTIANIAPIAGWVTSPEPPIAGALVTLDGTTSTDPDGEIVSWIWSVNGVPYSGSMVEILLGSGSHSVSLTVIDDAGSSGTTVSTLTFGTILAVNTLSANLVGTDSVLSWNGIADEYRIYRSTSPIESVLGMESVGSTDSTTWRETAPVATTLHYAVTMVIDGHEILWITSAQNTVSLDASGASQAVDLTPTGSIPSMQIPLLVIFFLLAAVSIGLSIFNGRRDDA